VKASNDNSTVPIGEILSGVLTSSNYPEDVSATLTFEARVHGVVLSDRASMIAGTTWAGIATRMHPGESLVSMINPMQASVLLSAYSSDFPAVVAWAEGLVQSVDICASGNQDRL
jgi:hypothetical protein